MRKAQPEFEIQKAIVLYLRSLKVLFNANTEGSVKKTMFQQVRAKAAGYEKGVPDILIFTARGKYHGMALEVKAPGGYPTPEQRAWQERLTAEGWYAVIMPAMIKTPMACAYWAREQIEWYLKQGAKIG